MPQFLIYNGQLIEQSTPIFTASNRAFKYGDAFFESIACIQYTIPLWQYHYDRILHTCKLLAMELSPSYSSILLHQQIIKLCQYNNLDNARIRISVFRQEGGLYRPTYHQAQVLIEASPTQTPMWQSQQTIEQPIGICSDYSKNYHKLSAIKSSSALLYVLTAHYAQKNNWYDALLLNDQTEIVETSSANIWLMHQQIIYTPSLKSGCVDGVARRYLLAILPKLGYQLIEKKLFISDLLTAQHVWLSNAVQGLSSLKQLIVANKRYAFEPFCLCPTWFNNETRIHK